jgi:hypothetical protein
MGHLMCESTRLAGDELLAWRCERCGRWIREFGPLDNSACWPPPHGPAVSLEEGVSI